MKKASQIDETKGTSKTYPASRAVDGNTNPNIRDNSCAHPFTNKNTAAWWKVDLNDTYRLYNVVIYNRDCCQLDKCGTHIGRVARSASVTTSCEAVGRYLEFRRTTTTTSKANVANFCEVVVIGHLFIGK